MRWVRQIEVEQNRITDMHQVLSGIFDEADAAHHKGRRESVFDTIYLVSDGFLTGGMIDRAEFLAWVRERNRMHRIRINTITLGAMDVDTIFMADLAAENYGSATLVEN